MAYNNLASNLHGELAQGSPLNYWSLTSKTTIFSSKISFLVVISDLWIWFSFSKLLEKTECCFMIGFSAGYDIQSCITLSQAALYVWKIGICDELDGLQHIHKLNTLAKIITWWRQANHRGSRPISSSSRTRTPLKSSVLTDIKAQGLNLVSEFPED